MAVVTRITDYRMVLMNAIEKWEKDNSDKIQEMERYDIEHILNCIGYCNNKFKPMKVYIMDKIVEYLSNGRNRVRDKFEYYYLDTESINKTYNASRKYITMEEDIFPYQIVRIIKILAYEFGNLGEWLLISIFINSMIPTKYPILPRTNFLLKDIKDVNPKVITPSKYINSIINPITVDLKVRYYTYSYSPRIFLDCLYEVFDNRKYINQWIKELRGVKYAKELYIGNSNTTNMNLSLKDFINSLTLNINDLYRPSNENLIKELPQHKYIHVGTITEPQEFTDQEALEALKDIEEIQKIKEVKHDTKQFKTTAELILSNEEVLKVLNFN